MKVKIFSYRSDFSHKISEEINDFFSENKNIKIFDIKQSESTGTIGNESDIDYLHNITISIFYTE